mmetsp:Transcript_9745/g.24549  ORF Transcript_9745/g.24549 Transcript_9745/m.24549 type:complete len:229 (+) Transcript_9745:1734-2420(+)
MSVPAPPHVGCSSIVSDSRGAPSWVDANLIEEPESSNSSSLRKAATAAPIFNLTMRGISSFAITLRRQIGPRAAATRRSLSVRASRRRIAISKVGVASLPAGNVASEGSACRISSTACLSNRETSTSRMRHCPCSSPVPSGCKSTSSVGMELSATAGYLASSAATATARPPWKSVRDEDAGSLTRSMGAASTGTKRDIALAEHRYTTVATCASARVSPSTEKASVLGQ